MKKQSPLYICACGNTQSYELCCGRWHTSTTEHPNNALSLMRSRYSAFVLRNWDYLLKTWHSSSRPVNLDDDTTTKWLGLEIKQHRCLSDTHATVEFVARYKLGSRAYRLHEISNFTFEHGRWYYVDGTFPLEKNQQPAVTSST